MKQFLVLAIAIAFVAAEKDEGHLKDKRAISTVHISSPYSQVRYAPGYPNYGGEQSQYHGVYVPSARHSYPSGYPPIFGQEFPTYSPPVFIPQHPGFHYPQPQPPFLIPGQPCEGESPQYPSYPSPGVPSRPPVFIPPHEDDAERIPPQPPMRPPSKIPPSFPPSSPMKPMPSPQPPNYPQPPPVEEDSDEHEPPLPPKPPVKRPPPPKKPPVNYPPVIPPQHPPPIEEDSDEHEFPSPRPPIVPPVKPPTKTPPQKPPTYYPPPTQPPMKPEMPPVHYPPAYPWPSVPPQNIPPPQEPPVEETPDCEGDVSYEDEEEEHPVIPPTPPVKPNPPSPPTYLPPQLPPSRPMKPVLPPPQLPPSRPMKPVLPPPQLPPIHPPTVPSYPPKKPNCDEEEEEDIPQIPHYTGPYYPQSNLGQSTVPSYQPGNVQTIPQQYPQNIPRVTTNRTPTEIHVTVQNMPGHIPRQDVPIPSPPPSQGPPTHLPEVPAGNRPRTNPSTPRIPYQPTNGYNPQYDTRPQYFPPQDYYPEQPQRPSIPRPQYFPPQDAYDTRQTPSYTPQYYPSYYPAQQYPNAQYPYYSRNTQKTSTPADAGKQGGIPAHNNGQFLVETTTRSYPRNDNNNYASTTQTPYTYNPYNNRQQQNNFASESSSTTRPIYSNDGHYITMRPNNRQQPTTHTTSTPRMNRFEVRRPAIHKQFYDVEEKIIMRPVGSVVLELTDDDGSASNAIMKIKHYHPKNYSQHDTNHSYSGDRYHHSSLHGRNYNNSRNNGSMKPGITYADQDMPIHFRDSSELKTPMHILSPFAAQNNTFDDDSEEDEPSAAYLYGKNMIKVNHPSEKTVTPCPPPSTYARYNQENSTTIPE
ncbi:uncharacterized protein LOC134837784 [Culicoides brevitarsis]|uniref:uncharacterized protein LOC134837784 n=1 Tax=Culicoides brevitarsis TaxID=469753 RepID=UPI00307BB234